MIVSLKGVLRFADPDAAWWKDPRPMRELLAALEKAGLRSRLKLAGKDGAALAAKKDLAAWSTTWEAGDSYVLSADKKSSPARTQLYLTPKPGTLKLWLTLGPADADPRRQTLLDTFADLSRALHERMGCGLFHFVVDLETDYARAWGPRMAGNWWVGVVMMIVDPKTDADAYDRKAAKREVDSVLRARLPRGATREKLDDLIVFRFVPDLTDDAAIDRARAVQDQWICSVVGSEVSPFWNEQGDEMVLLLSAKPHPPATLYDTSTRHAYKAMFEAKDAEVVKAERWVMAGQLPDGTPIDGVSIVLTSRKSAIAAAKRVRAKGMRVLYTDSSGTFWDPFPPGIKRSPRRSTARTRTR